MTRDAKERRPRRRFSKEFKAEVVELVRSSGQTVGAVSRRMDLTETAVRDWVRQAGVPPASRTRNLCCPPDLQELLVLHRRQVSQGAVESASIVPVQPLKNKHSSFGNCLEM